jgi:uncharacterized repeat protein (TIGR01451 family)
LTNNIVVDNQASTTVGGGLYIKGSSPHLLHTTIARNGDGSGIYVTISDTNSSAVAMTNTILVSHTVGIAATANNTATLKATLWGNTADWNDDGTVTPIYNYWGNPYFANPDAGDYHIGPGSAAINKGVPVNVSVDIDGDDRLIGSDHDLGADECRAALRVSKQATPNPVQAGERLTYTIRVTNTGGVDLHATVTDTLFPHVMPGGVFTRTPIITAPGGVWTETFVVTVEMDYVGPLTNVVQVTTDESARGVYTETTWSHACYAQISGTPTITYTTVQAAVDAANVGDTVKVVGTCVGVETRAGVTQTVYISKNITLRGGYTTTNWSTPYPITQPTTLNALGRGRVIYIIGSIGPTIEGLRIIGGDASGLGGGPEGNDAGGGIYVMTATATISRTWVFTNTAYHGGGLFLSSSNTMLNGNIIFNNHAVSSSGGLYLFNSPATLNGNIISSNTAAGWYGGGLYLFYSDATLNDNTVSNNYAANSSGGLYLSASHATLNDNIISGNTAKWAGGGLYLNDSNATLNGNTISSNSADSGAGLHQYQGNVMLSGDTIISNTASGNGGGVYVELGNTTLIARQIISNIAGQDGGGVCAINATIAVRDSRILNNITQHNGGGLYLYESDSTLINNIIADNRADVLGSGLYVGNSSPRLLHTTIARNSGGDGSGIHVTNDGPTYSAVVLTNTILVSHAVGITVTAGNTATLEVTLWGTDTWANLTDWGDKSVVVATVNRRGDPVFLAPDIGVYHIRFDSAARGEGMNAGINTDIDGQVRPGGEDNDIGADEWNGIFLPLASRHWPPVPDPPVLDPIDNTDGDSSYTVYWSVVSQTTYYVLEEATNNDFSNADEVYSDENNEHTVNDKGAGRYYYRVRACNTWGCSAWSDKDEHDKYVYADVLWEREPNDNGLTQANGPIVCDSLTYYGTFPSPSDIKDYFYFDLPTPCRVELWLTNIPSGHDYDLCLRDDSLNVIKCSQNSSNAGEHILTGILPAGRYKVQVYNYSRTGSTQPYHLRLTCCE